MPNHTSRPVFVVLGMHRSGTSAVARGLAALGVSLGDNLMPPAPDNNNRGFFEDLDIYHLNERLLSKARSVWHKLAPLDSVAMTGPAFSPERREAGSLLAQKIQAGPFGFKDPRTALLLPFWRCVFEDLGLDARYVIVVRNPFEAAASLEARDRIPLTKGIALWAKHTIEAFRHTQGETRVVIAYDRLLHDPYAELRRMAVALALPEPNADSEQTRTYCEEFLTPNLRHNRISAYELKRSGLAPDFISELYSIVGALAVTPPGADAETDAQRWGEIAARYDETAPLLAYADHLANDLIVAREQLETAKAQWREADALIHKAASELDEARQTREGANLELEKARADLRHTQRVAEVERRRLAGELEAHEHAAESERLRLVAALGDSRRAGEAERARLLAELKEKQQATEAERARFAAELEAASAAQAIASEQLRRSAFEYEQTINRLEKRLLDSEQALARERAETACLSAAVDESISAQTKAKEGADQEAAAARAHVQAAEDRLLSVSARLEQLQTEHGQLARTSAERDREVAQLVEENAALTQRYRDARRDLFLARGALTETRQSMSWRLTAPVRAAGMMLRDPISGTRAAVRAAASAAWRRLPMSAEQCERLTARMFSVAPALFSWSRAYKSWAATNAQADGGDRDEHAESSPDPALEGYVPLLATAQPQSVSARAIAYYLPQFHPIPENDRWWGDGFTEWTKVRAAEPCFDGHYQPREPGELGYYDLLKDDDVMRRQAELAKLHGVGGFCFYFYWFGGRRLLDAPIQKLRDSRDIDMPFCLCWANENWTRRWDGKANEVLIAQEHSAEDDIAFIAHVSQYFSDSRYIRIRGRPLLIVYRPALLPSAKATAERWRRWLREHGMGEVYLAYTQSFEHASPGEYGFDAAIEFPPNNMGLVSNPALVNAPPGDLSVYDWRMLRARAKCYTKPAYTLFRGVTPQWDNTPRRARDGAVFVNTSPSAFSAWVADAVRDTVERFPDPQERLIFVNAWNEWAEGAHLEPDRKYGYAWLEAIRRALDPTAGQRRLLIVTHDLHRHGAQYLALNLARTLRRCFGFEVATISGQTGALRPAFENEGQLTIIKPHGASESAADAAFASLVQRGFRCAIVNSAASGWIAPRLARFRMKMIGLVHELPAMIECMHLGQGLAELDRHAEALVFPAATVRDKCAGAVGVASWRNAKVLPQGLYKSGALMDLSAKEAARERIVARLGLPNAARIVLGVGYADERKGVDIFIAWATATARSWPHAHFVWVGAPVPELQHKVKRWLAGARAQRANIHFPGFMEETGDFYAAADLYALCSREDPFPSTALEALAAATPVITVQGTGGIEELEAHGCVKAIASADADAFVAAAADWFDNPDAARAAGERGRNLVCERFGFASYAGALTDLLGLGVPNISVVVPNYNYARCLEQRLQSIIGQTLAPREILFLDDASSDDSVAAAERVLAGAPINWRIVRNARNSGDVFAQWRKGVGLAQGEFVWIAEADDWADPRFLETAARPFRRSDIVLSMTQSQQASGYGRLLAVDYLDYVRDVSADKWKRPFIADGGAEIREGLSIKNTIPNVSAVLFRRLPLLDVLQTYAREIGSYRVAGDWCVYVNVLRRGSIAFSPAALNYHRRHDVSVTIAKFDLAELAEIARMQAYVAREFAPSAEYAARAHAYLESLVRQFELDRRWSAAQIEGAMRGVIAA